MATAKPKTRTTASTHTTEPTPAQVNAAVMSFALLADPTRVRILWALRDNESDVAILGCASPYVARPSRASTCPKLRFAGLVEGTRDGRRVVYQLRGGHVRNLLTEALFHADHHISGQPSQLTRRMILQSPQRVRKRSQTPNASQHN